MSPPSQPPSHLTLHPTLQSVTFFSGNPIKLTPASSSGPLPLPSDVTRKQEMGIFLKDMGEKYILGETTCLLKNCLLA